VGGVSADGRTCCLLFVVRVRQRSRLLINLGSAGFAATVLWFYFSSVMDKLGRSFSLIALGLLFLLGGWLLERVRRRLVARISPEVAA